MKMQPLGLASPWGNCLQATVILPTQRHHLHPARHRGLVSTDTQPQHPSEINGKAPPTFHFSPTGCDFAATQEVSHPRLPLTAQGWSSPRLDDDTSVLASGGVALDALAKDAGVPLSQANVVEAGLEIRGWVDEVAAGVKGAFWEREDAAVVGFLEDHLLLLRADGAVVLRAVVIAIHFRCFPGRAKDHGGGGLLATGEEEVIITLPIVVATEPAKVALVARRDRDRHVVEEVIAYGEAEVSLKQDTHPVLVHLDLPLVQDDREVVGY